MLKNPLFREIEIFNRKTENGDYVIVTSWISITWQRRKKRRNNEGKRIHNFKDIAVDFEFSGYFCILCLVILSLWYNYSKKLWLGARFFFSFYLKGVLVDFSKSGSDIIISILARVQNLAGITVGLLVLADQPRQGGIDQNFSLLLKCQFTLFDVLFHFTPFVCIWYNYLCLHLDSILLVSEENKSLPLGNKRAICRHNE